MEYRTRYLAALGLVLLSSACYAFATLENWHFGAAPGVWMWLGAVVVAGGFVSLLWYKGLVFFKSAPLDLAAYLLLAGVALALLNGLLCSNYDAPRKATGGAGWELSLDNLSPDDAPEEGGILDGLGTWINPLGALKALLGFIAWYMWQIFVALGQVLLWVLSPAALLAGILLLVFAMKADVKSGVVLVIAVLLLVEMGLVVQGSTMLRGRSYVIAGSLALLVSLCFAVNWRAIWLNVDVSHLHPASYGIVADLAKHRKSITRNTIKEQCLDRVPEQVKREFGAETVTGRVIDRLSEEEILVPQEDGTYRLGVRKQLGLFDVVLAMVALLWLANPTMGVVEIPDNLPLVGNIDEALFAFGLVRVYRKYRADMRQIRREKRAESPSGEL